jgi:CRISPR-associated protein Cas2
MPSWPHSIDKLVSQPVSQWQRYASPMRTQYLVAYDVSNPRRLRKVCRYLTGFKVGGQKSVFEIWVTPAELEQIRAELDSLIDAEEDRLHIFALDPRMKPHCLGNGKNFDQTFFSIL